MLSDALMALGLMKNCYSEGVYSGDGVGLTYICENVLLSKYMVRKLLGNMVRMGFLVRKGNQYFRTVAGVMLVDADNRAWADLLQRGVK